jgi:hypothetical protein
MSIRAWLQDGHGVTVAFVRYYSDFPSQYIKVSSDPEPRHIENFHSIVGIYAMQNIDEYCGEREVVYQKIEPVEVDPMKIELK